MRYLFLCLFCFSMLGKSLAQQTVIPVGADGNSNKIYLATENDSIRAFVVANPDRFSFWVKVNGSYQKVGQMPASSSQDYLGSISTEEDIYFIFDANKSALVQFRISLASLKNGQGYLSSTGLQKSEGKPISSFVHEGVAYNLSYTKKGNQLRLRKFGLSGEAVDMDFTIPISSSSSVNVSYGDLKKLEYRPNALADPSLLHTKKHIFMSEDAMYLVYPKYNQYYNDFVIMKFGLQNGLADSHVVYGVDTEHANIYFHNNRFLFYTINSQLLSLSALDPQTWKQTSLYSLSSKEEKLHDVKLQNETTRMWWDIFSNDRMDQAKLMRKLSKGSAYVYVNPTKTAGQQQEIVVGAYATGTTGGGMVMGAGGIPAGPMMMHQYVIHPYTMMVYNAEAGSMASSTAVWRSPASVWDSILNGSSIFGLNAYNTSSPALIHLGDQALIAYVDRKHNNVVVRYEPLQQMGQMK